MRLSTAVILFAWFVFPGGVEADSYVVEPDGTGDFPTIQAAIDAAADGDFIALAPGVFTGEGNVAVNFQGKAVTVEGQGADPEDCVVACSYAARGFTFSSEESTDSVLRNLTVSAGYASSGSGARIIGASPTIENCIFEDCHATNSGGGLYLESSLSAVQGCRFRGSHAGHRGGGLYSWQSSPTIAWCTFSGNSAAEGGGLAISNEASITPEIEHCTIYGNAASNNGGSIYSNNDALLIRNSIMSASTDGQGIYCTTDDVVLTCCDIFGNEGGDWVGHIADQLGVTGNISEPPLFCSPETGDFTLQEGSPCAPFTEPNPQCDLIGSWEVGCYPTPAASVSWGELRSRFLQE